VMQLDLFTRLMAYAASPVCQEQRLCGHLIGYWDAVLSRGHSKYFAMQGARGEAVRPLS
jgi:hypothetical protein